MIFRFLFYALLCTLCTCQPAPEAVPPLPSEAVLVLKFHPDSTHTVHIPPPTRAEWSAVMEEKIATPVRRQVAAVQRWVQHTQYLPSLVAHAPVWAALTLRPQEQPLLIFDLQGNTAHLQEVWENLPLGTTLEVKASRFRDQTIWLCSHAQGGTLAFAEQDGWLLCAAHIGLIEDALSQDKNNTHWAGAEFLADGVLPGTLRVVLHPDLLVERLHDDLAPAYVPLLTTAARHVHWVGFEWDGVHLTLDLATQGGWAEAVEQGSGSASEVGAVLPAHTALLLQAHFADGSDFLKKSGHPPDETWQHYVLPWWGNEVAVGVTEPTIGDLPGESFVVLQARDTALASASLRDYAQSFGLIQLVDHQTFCIFHLAEGRLLKSLVGEGGAFTQPACAVVGGYVIFAASRPALEHWIDLYVVGETLAANPDFLALLQEQNGASWGGVFARMDAWAAVGSGVFAPAGWRIHGPTVRAWSVPGWVGIQMETIGAGRLRGRVAHRSLGAGYGSPAEGLAWRVALESEVLSAPVLVCRASEAGGQALLVQDARYVLHCLSGEGVLRWSRRLPGPVLATIEVLDYWGNGSCCYFFNTPQALWLLDENGKDIEGFPLRLKSGATNGASVRRTGEVRGFEFFVALENGNVQGFNYLGQPLAGWNPQVIGEEVRAPVHAVAHKGQDYVAVLTRSGRLRVYGQNGHLHFPVVQWQGEFLTPMAVGQEGGQPVFVAASRQGEVFSCDVQGRSGLVSFAGSAVSGGRAAVGSFPEGGECYAATWKEGRLVGGWMTKGGWKPLFSPRDVAAPERLFLPEPGWVGALYLQRRQVAIHDSAGARFFPGTTACCVLSGMGPRPLLIVGDGAGVCAYTLGHQ